MPRPSKRDAVLGALSVVEARTTYQVSELADCSVRTVQRHLRPLVDAGVVSTATSWVGHHYGYTRVYWLRGGGRPRWARSRKVEPVEGSGRSSGVPRIQALRAAVVPLLPDAMNVSRPVKKAP